MKKLIALLLIAALAVSMCACSRADKKDEKGAEGQEQGQDATGGAEDTTEPFDITTLSNYYQDLSEPQVVEGKLSYQIFQAWYEDEALVLDIYFINGHTEPVTSVWFDELSIYNGDAEIEGEVIQGGLISYAAVGPVELEEPVPAGGYSIVKMHMPKDMEGYLVDLTMDVIDSYEW